MKLEREKWLLLFVLTIIWGSSFILIKKSLEHYTPYQVGSLRVLIAGIVLLPLAIKGLKYFPKNRIKWLLVTAFCGNFFPMFLFPLAETEVSSSVAGIVNAMMPIFVILVGLVLWKFTTTKTQIIGVLVSFVGACIIAIGGDSSGTLKIVPILLLLLATVMYAISSTTVKAKLLDVPAKALSGFIFSYVLFLPSLLSLCFTGFFREFDGRSDRWIGLGFVGLLSIFGTGLAMMLNYRLLNISTPLFASTVTLLMPIVAILWGVLDGEELSSAQIVGGVIIIAGLVFLRKQSK